MARNEILLNLSAHLEVVSGGFEVFDGLLVVPDLQGKETIFRNYKSSDLKERIFRDEVLFRSGRKYLRIFRNYVI